MKDKIVKLTLKQLQLISHCLGIDLFNAVMSDKMSDKTLPKGFYRNYYNCSKSTAEVNGIDELIKGDMMFAHTTADIYCVSTKGIDKFIEQFNELTKYTAKSKRDIEYLKMKICFYCDFYNYKFGDDNAGYIINTYKNYWLKKYRVSHTTEDVIKRFEKELRKYVKNAFVLEIKN